MTHGFSSRKSRQACLKPAYFVIAGLAALVAVGGDARAGRVRNERPVESVESRAAGEAILAVVSLHRQRITIYDANGWILRAPVSSGRTGRETPAGIFSVIEKEAEHYSNLYDDAYMPHMQRLTWSGIALHGGPLPGYPASHGCIRLPFDFAARLFDATSLGLRVIVTPNDVAPVEIVHPLLLRPKQEIGVSATARIAEANEAARKEEQARGAAGKAYREAMQATVPARVAENLKARAEAQLAAAETSLASASSDDARQKAEDAKAKAAASITELQVRLDAAKSELQPKLDALKAAREEAAAAQAARAAAAEAARQAARELEPLSVLISRKTQRLYVRQAFEPIFESPVTIQDADRPIGTHVFTAIERAGGDTNIRWNVVSLDDGQPHGGVDERPGPAPKVGSRDAEATSAKPENAKAALDRIVIPDDALDRVSGMTPRSSVIVTDEALSSETGKRTDFVVLLSSEPQGGIKFRRRRPAPEFGYARSRDHLPYWGSPFRSPFSIW